jgi:hypothetical protein
MKIESAIHTLRPGAKWTIYGGTYSGLVWQDTQQSKPTEEEVAAAMLLPEPVAVPQEVPMWALKEVCVSRGHTTAIDTALAGLSEPPRVKATLRWEYKDTISRGSSMISALQALLGWSDAYVDELFVAADTLAKS